MTHLQLKTASFHGGEWNEKKIHATTHILGVALWVYGITRRLPGSFADGVCHELSQQKSTQKREDVRTGRHARVWVSPPPFSGAGGQTDQRLNFFSTQLDVDVLVVFAP